MSAQRVSSVMLCLLAVFGMATAAEMNDVPAGIKAPVAQRDFTQREVMIPMRDRNPQTFVPNIFNAKPTDYRKAEITILRTKTQATAIVLPVVN